MRHPDSRRKLRAASPVSTQTASVLGHLHGATLALQDGQSVQEIATIVAQHVRAATAARHVAFAVVHEGAARLDAVSDVGAPRVFGGPMCMALDEPAPSTRAVALRSTVISEAVDESPRSGTFGGPWARTVVAVPVQGAHKVLAVIELSFVTDRRLLEEERMFLDSVASETGRAMDRVERRVAESRAGTRAALLADASMVLTSSRDLEATLVSVARMALPQFGTVCAVDLIVGGRRLQRIAHAQLGRVGDAPAPVTRELRADHPLARAIATGRPVAALSTTDEDAMDPELGAADGAPIHAFLAVPLQSRGHPFGSLLFATSEAGRPYTEEDRNFAEDLAQRAALALDNARLLEESRRAVRARDDVLAVVCHDLRGHLNVIVGTLALLEGALEREGEAPRTRAYVDNLNRTADRMTALLGDLLDTAAVESGTLSMDVHEYDVRHLAEEAVLQLRPMATMRGVELHLETPGPCPASCDRMRILQVLANLIGNAIKFTDEGGEVRLEVGRDETSVRVAVVDTGQGIAEDRLPHVFDRFWCERERGNAGTGLGLTIAQGIAIAHGSRITVESTVGKGSRFVFALRTASVA
jgi:signal transduction histidine kinase